MPARRMLQSKAKPLPPISPTSALTHQPCRRDKDMSVTPTGGSATGIEENNSGATIAYQSVDLVFNASGYAPIPLSL